MNAKSLIAATLIGSLALGSSSLVLAGPGNGNGGQSVDAPTSAVVDPDLTEIEISDLRYMREEEKLARDVYLTLDGQWSTQTQVFARIALSEEDHTTTVDYLLDKFGVEDPVVNETIGVFTNQELQCTD